MSHHHQVDSKQEDNNNNNNYPLDSNSYKLLNLIGRGVSAKVYKALCIPLNSSPVAIKSINLEKTRSDLESVRREAKTLTLLSHPNICKAHCSFTVKSQLWVVMPFMSCGSLQSIMSSSHPNGLTEPLISIVLREVLNALSYLHGQGHLHRDIKAGNILVDSSGFVKLADFGVSASIYEWSSSSLMLTDIAGTPYWMAPEVIHSHTGYSYKADIWSFGITALELAHGRPPLSHLPPSKSLVMKITKRFRFSDHYEKGPDCKNKKKFSRAFKDMVGLCLDQDPSKRPSADKLLKHSFFKNCKGQDYLVRNLLQGLPSVENRFRLLRAGGDDEDDDVEGENITKQRRISGWNFNVEGFELDPVFPLSEDSGVGGEDVKVKIDRDDKGGDDVGSSEEGSRHGPTSMQRAMVRGCNEAADIEKRVVLEGLIALKKSLDEQRREVVRVIMSISNGGGDDLQNSEIISKEDSYQMMMMQVNERLRVELENERKKRFGLEMELEFLKMQMSD